MMSFNRRDGDDIGRLRVQRVIYAMVLLLVLLPFTGACRKGDVDTEAMDLVLAKLVPKLRVEMRGRDIREIFPQARYEEYAGFMWRVLDSTNVFAADIEVIVEMGVRFEEGVVARTISVISLGSPKVGAEQYERTREMLSQVYGAPAKEACMADGRQPHGPVLVWGSRTLGWVRLHTFVMPEPGVSIQESRADSTLGLMLFPPRGTTLILPQGYALGNCEVR